MHINLFKKSHQYDNIGIKSTEISPAIQECVSESVPACLQPSPISAVYSDPAKKKGVVKRKLSDAEKVRQMVRDVFKYGLLIIINLVFDIIITLIVCSSTSIRSVK